MTKEKSHEPKPAAQAPNNAPEELLTHPAYEELLQQLNAAEQKVNEHWERILRMQAESDNLARRAERDVANAHQYGIEKFVRELLPIIDSLELCLTSVPENMKSSAKPVLDGVDLTLKMFYTAMEKFGIRQVKALGEPFNPEFEQAISMQPDAGSPPGTVLSVMQKGYTLNNRLLRPALVVVSKEE